MRQPITGTPSQAAKLAAVRVVAEQAARMAAVLEANPELIDDPQTAAELAGIEPPTTATAAIEWGTADEWPETSQPIEWETWTAADEWDEWA